MPGNHTDYMTALLAELTGLDGPQAVAALQRAAEEYPRDPRPLLLLGGLFMGNKQVDRAEAAYVLAVQRAPDFAIARFQLGLLRYTSDRPAAAVATWGPLEDLADDDPLRLFKNAFEAMLENRFEDARDLFVAGMAANRVNEPLNRDMQKVIDRMVTMGLLREGADGSATSTELSGPPQEHVLVSSYRPRGDS